MKKKKKTTGIRLDQFANSLGHVDEKKLFSLLYPNSKAPRTKPELKPFAQSNLLCKFREKKEPAEITLRSKIEKIKSKDIKLYYIAYLQFAAGLRISEVLNISVFDISLSGHISVKSLKHSANSVIHGGEAADYLINCKINKTDPFDMYNRWYVYRQYQKHGISFQSKISSVASVTHAMRHVAAQSLRSANVSDSQLQKFMRHKNARNTKQYGKS